MYKNILLIILIAGICLLDISCTEVREGPGPGVRIRDPKAPYSQIRYNDVAIVDKSLEDWPVKKTDILGFPVEQQGKMGKIAVESQGARRTATNTLEVWATLRNRTNHPLQIEGRVQFFDKDKAPVEGPTAWQRVFLPENSVAAYKETSTRIDVAYYYTEIREGR